MTDAQSLKVVYWESKPPRNQRVRIEGIKWFSARGMKRVYGRGDHFPGRAGFHMDIWRNRHGQLFVRFWSRGEEVDDCSLTILGIRPDSIPDGPGTEGFTDHWLPKALRTEYETWVISES